MREMYKYVAEVDPPTLIDLWNAFCSQHKITPGQVISAFGHRDRTVREMLKGERPMSLHFFGHWCEFVGADRNEAVARYVGSLAPEEIGAIQRAEYAVHVTSCSASEEHEERQRRQG